MNIIKRCIRKLIDAFRRIFGLPIIIEQISQLKFENDRINNSINKLYEQLNFENDRINYLISENKAKFSELASREIDLKNILSHSIINSIAFFHEKSFLDYKNVYSDREIVLLGTGKSLNKFMPINNAICIGANRAIFFDKVHCDYIFFQDKQNRERKFYESMKEYDAVKFFGIVLSSDQYNMDGIFKGLVTESFTISTNAKRYYAIFNPDYPTSFTYDIAHLPFGDGGSVLFPMIQFALWTNPKRIYLVGCDCDQGYFDGTHSICCDCSYLIPQWEKLKEFAEAWYPETEIVSVNPVGLKGMFKDIYQ